MLATVSLMIVAISMLATSIYHTYLVIGLGRSYRWIQMDGDVGRGGGSLSIITPIKNEPIEIVERYFKLSTTLIESIETYAECIIVADYTDNTMFDSIPGLLSSANPNIVVVRRLNGFGGRNGAINDGVKLALGTMITFIDVDAEPSQRVLESMARCRGVCISWWRICDKDVSRVSRTIAFITEYGSWLYYWLKSLRNLFLYPLGSGTVLDRNLFTSIGGLRVDVIQDDIWLGTQLLYRGMHPVIIEPMCVGAPRTLDAFVVQQRRWAYGAVDVLKRFGIYILRSPAPVGIRIEALVYLLQPLVAAISGLGLLLSIVSAFTEVVEFGNLHTASIAILITSMALESIAVHKFLRWSRDPQYDPPYIVGRASAVSVVLSIEVLPYVLAALIGVKIPYRVTPKGKHRGEIPASIKITALAFAVALATSIVRGNRVATLVTALGAASLIYTIVRL